MFYFSYLAEVTTSPTLWAGTNSGQILVFVISIPKDEEKRKDDKVEVNLGKEIQLRHRAPVLAIQVLDGSCIPVTSTSQSDPGTGSVGLGNPNKNVFFLIHCSYFFKVKH